jgi:glyoxylase-like metal-dependent hydrolase (beta-lactamase superfamily II)
MQRRQFLKNSSFLLGAYPFMPIIKSGILLKRPFADAEVFKLQIGTLSCTFFRDTLHIYLAKSFFSNAAPAELDPALTRYHITPDNIPSPFIAVLLQQGDKKVLIDTGIGFAESPVTIGSTSLQFKGRLHQLLEQQNIAQEDITDVIITHFHPDHIGGVFSEGQKLLFPNARFHMHEDEWRYWHSPQSDNQPPMFRYFIEKNITRLKEGNLHLIKGDFVELLPGITTVMADGHTPGQIALILHSGNERLLYISDAFLHPLHIERLDWQTSYDLDHAKAKSSRIKLLQLARKEDMLVNAFHFDFPGLGRIDKHKNNWLWNYTHK